MSIKDEITELETRLLGSGHTVKKMLALAQIDQSTWHRWKSCQTEPGLFKWRAAIATTERLLEENPK